MCGNHFHFVLCVGGSAANFADDDSSSLGDDNLDDFGFDELVFTLTQLQSDAATRKATDLEQLGQSVIRGTRKGKPSQPSPVTSSMMPISHRMRKESPDVARYPEEHSQESDVETCEEQHAGLAAMEGDSSLSSDQRVRGFSKRTLSTVKNT